MKRLPFLPFILLTSSGSAQALWGELKAGPFPIGFRSVWSVDYSRQYEMRFDDGTLGPRPVLVNIWYPAAPAGGPKMPYGDYFKIDTEKKDVGKFASKLKVYNRSVFVSEIFGKAEPKLSREERKALATLLATRTGVRRNAPKAGGTFPLLIYHAGNGSSFDDNSLLCEYLASQGYVVLGSAFQKLDGSSFNVEGAGSTGDFKFLIRLSSSFPNVDPRRIGLLGHSAGAQASLIFQSTADSPVKAIVSLDTTEDYHSPEMPIWDYLTKPVLANLDQYTIPIMFAADSEACFVMADMISNCLRWFFTANSLGHNDFISQGLFARRAKSKLQPTKSNLNDCARVEHGYGELCKAVGLFFTTTLKGTPNASKVAALTAGRPRPDRVHLEISQPGESGPPEYLLSDKLPPTPRQLRPVLKNKGVDKVAEIIRKFKAMKDVEPIYHGTFAFALLYELVSKGRTDDAKTLLIAYRSAKIAVAETFLAWGTLARIVKRPKLELDLYQKLLSIDPGNKEAGKRLAQFKSSSP